MSDYGREEALADLEAMMGDYHDDEPVRLRAYIDRLTTDPTTQDTALSGSVEEAQLYDQSIVSPENGDCLRAAIATMMQWHPSELPNFVEDANPWQLVYTTGVERGFALLHEPIDKAAECNQSPTGWMMATVPSRKFPGENHSVVVDNDLRLVHDPNPPEWKRDSIERSDILGILVAFDLHRGRKALSQPSEREALLERALELACNRQTRAGSEARMRAVLELAKKKGLRYDEALKQHLLTLARKEVE